MSFQALAVACMATEQLPSPEWDDEFGWWAEHGDTLDVEWVIYDSIGAGVILRVRSVAWAWA